MTKRSLALIIRPSTYICVAPYYVEVICGLSGCAVFLANCLVNGTILGTLYWYEMCVVIHSRDGSETFLNQRRMEHK